MEEFYEEGSSYGVFLAFVFCLFTSFRRAQVTGATLNGTVTDASGAVVAGAQVSLRNLATGVIREATTDSSGRMLCRTWRPLITSQGHGAGILYTCADGLTLAVGAQQTLNFSLKVGETSTTVQVTEAARKLNSIVDAYGQVESETVRELL